MIEEELRQIQGIYDTIAQFLVQYSFQLIGALIIVGIGIWISKKLGNALERFMVTRTVDVTLSRFTGNTAQMILLVMVGMIALGKLGVSITPLIAAIGAISLGAGLAMQGMLSNYAAGFTIIVTRPFVVGDTIRVQGVTGLVQSVHLPYTILIDEDDVRIQLPNRLVIGEILHNSAAEKLIEITVGVAYSSNPRDVVGIIRKALATIPGISSMRGPLIGIEKFGESSIQIGVRFWAPTNRYFETLYAANLAIHDALLEAQIHIPFPQRDIHIKQQ